MGLQRIADELQSGMILDQDIYTKDKVLLLAKGSVIYEEQIRIIKRLGYSSVSIRQKEPDAGEFSYWHHIDENKFNEFEHSYSESKKELNDIMKSISSGGQVDLEQVYSIPEMLLQQVGTPYNLFAFLNNVRQLDDYTYSHSVNVSVLCGVLCKWLKLDEATCKEIITAGLLHDLGKCHIPPEILNKPEKLTAEEWEEVKKHPVYGYRLLETAKAPHNIKIGALMHHEREDGSGYPTGLKGDQIPLIAKIIAIADVYDAMTSRRPHREKICPFQVIDQFQHDFFNLLDTKLLMTFLNRVADCYVGEVVRLSDGRTGQVVVINPAYPARPMIRNRDGIINLVNEHGVEIVDILPVGANS
ncbi:HD-GYP domain [Desulfocucumis palustris]|uniref:HD-GYP domain n=1 Tax=Desulfocucumis palustris TaxID=1898651 RepID=A0A2L2XA40_9FIRM|nr:HD-GYP domain-containing protein [Desulfocucumis palustris]GBF33065.1 HD-GYP domain [Desulfocucumis palustris]